MEIRKNKEKNNKGKNIFQVPNNGLKKQNVYNYFPVLVIDFVF